MMWMWMREQERAEREIQEFWGRKGENENKSGWVRSWIGFVTLENCDSIVPGGIGEGL